MPASITWTPADQQLLTVSKPAATVATISSSGAGGLINPVYEIVSSSLPSGIVATVNNPTDITISGNSLLALPPSEILYVVGTVLGSTNNILEVPPNADPYGYTSNTSLQITYSLEVKVTYEYVDPPGTFLSSNKIYDITVNNSWNADKAAVQSLMERYN